MTQPQFSVIKFRFSFVAHVSLASASLSLLLASLYLFFNPCSPNVKKIHALTFCSPFERQLHLGYAISTSLRLTWRLANIQSKYQHTDSTDSSPELPLWADHLRRQKLALVEIPEWSKKVLPSVPLPPSTMAASPPQSSRKDQLKLQLHMGVEFKSSPLPSSNVLRSCARASSGTLSSTSIRLLTN